VRNIKGNVLNFIHRYKYTTAIAIILFVLFSILYVCAIEISSFCPKPQINASIVDAKGVLELIVKKLNVDPRIARHTKGLVSIVVQLDNHGETVTKNIEMNISKIRSFPYKETIDIVGIPYDLFLYVGYAVPSNIIRTSSKGLEFEFIYPGIRAIIEARPLYHSLTINITADKESNVIVDLCKTEDSTEECNVYNLGVCKGLCIRRIEDINASTISVEAVSKCYFLTERIHLPDTAVIAIRDNVQQIILIIIFIVLMIFVVEYRFSHKR